MSDVRPDPVLGGDLHRPLPARGANGEHQFPVENPAEPRYKLVVAMGLVENDGLVANNVQITVARSNGQNIVIGPTVFEGNRTQLFRSALTRLISLFEAADNL